MRLLVLLSMLIFAGPVAAAVTYEEETKTLVITGGTTPAQHLAVVRQSAIYDIEYVRLSGPGGHFYTGLQIGRLINEKGWTVTIPEGGVCWSACGLAALGAKKLFVEGTIGLHYPYLSQIPSSLSPLDYASHAGGAFLDMASYLVEMGYPLAFSKYIITESTFCRMLAINSETEISGLRGPPTADKEYDMNVLDECE